MISIAIDGPSGAGKSTLAKTLAGRLGYTYIDTGALYRSIGLYALRRGIDPGDHKGVVPLLREISLELQHRPDGQHVLLCGEDVSGLIRTPEVSMAASKVSAIPQVREFLLETQRSIARRQNVIMDGRDIGTVILPNAQIKIFLTASAEDRARRRFEELREKDPSIRYEDVLHDVIERDQNDSSRALAPLAAAPDAIRVDTSGNTLEKSIDLLGRLIDERLALIQD